MQSDQRGQLDKLTWVHKWRGGEGFGWLPRRTMTTRPACIEAEAHLRASEFWSVKYRRRRESPRGLRLSRAAGPGTRLTGCKSNAKHWDDRKPCLARGRRFHPDKDLAHRYAKASGPARAGPC